MKVKTRFAPSPTGSLHLGSIRTALYSWLFARRFQGEFILRIEDTDLERFKMSSIKSIIDGLKWLGLNWDQGPYFQTKRFARYREIVQSMLDSKNAYKCFCSLDTLDKERNQQILKGEKPRYSGTCRNLDGTFNLKKKYVIRFKNPRSGKVKFIDAIRGEIVFENQELDDFIIQRSNGTPTYNFCVVVDDLDMQITHVIRGEDHINNTPRQINIFHALQATIPTYAHVSMILDETGQKISKRKSAVSILEYRDKGILPEALVNYIVRLGWSYGDQEIFSISEMKNLFNFKSITKSPSIINTKKLLWINKHYINHLSINYITDLFRSYIQTKNIDINHGPCLKSVIQLLKSRCNTLEEIVKSCRYFYEELDYLKLDISNKYLTSNNLFILNVLNDKIFSINTWNEVNIFKLITAVSLELSITKKLINMILRVVLTGNIYSPNISSVIFVIGKNKTLFRIKNAIYYIQKK